ncbi:jacalin-like lectin, partial [Acinetobacter baumannii]
MIMGPEAIKSLTFHTTRRKFGPYGEEQGQLFSTKLKEGSVVVGFHGKKGLFVDAIGVHVLEGKVPIPPPSVHNPNPILSSMPISKKSGSNSPVKSHKPKAVLFSMPNAEKPGSNSPVKSLNMDPVLSSMPNSKKPGSSSPTKPTPQTALALPKKVDNSQWPFNIGKQGQ